MTRVSKKKLKKSVENHILREFIKMFSSIPKFSAQNFYFQFLSSAEKIMFAKRIAVIYMLLEKASFRQISNTLKVGVSTVERINNDLVSGNFKEIEKHLKKKINRDRFWLDFEKILRAGMPKIGKGRWEWLNSI